MSDDQNKGANATHDRNDRHTLRDLDAVEIELVSGALPPCGGSGPRYCPAGDGGTRIDGYD